MAFDLHRTERWLNRYRIIVVATALIFVSGCGNNEPMRLPVQGTIQLDGQPIDSATIILTSESDRGVVASANIVQGAFQFSKKDGPTPGRYKARINPGEIELEHTEHDLAKLKKARKPRIPKKFQNDGKLFVDVPSNPEEPIKIDLSTKARQ